MIYFIDLRLLNANIYFNLIMDVRDRNLYITISKMRSNFMIISKGSIIVKQIKFIK
jgi:hypothetical protein